MAITTSQFKTYFARDFSYYSGAGATGSAVTDDDITRAIAEAGIVFNPGIFAGDTVGSSTAELYLTAHFLSENLNAQTGAGRTANFPTQHKAAGAVMESFAIPEWVSKSPTFSAYSTTRYGQRYLSMIYPLMIGNAVVFDGATTP